MSTTAPFVPVDVPDALLDAIRNFPSGRVVEHCGKQWSASPFDFYSRCPQCGAQIKLRSFTAGAELEDVFDAVFEWMDQHRADALVNERRKALASDSE